MSRDTTWRAHPIDESLAMRIGIDGSCLSNRRGFGRFARQLLEALSQQATEHEFTVFVDRPSAATCRVPERFERVVVDGARGAEPGGVGPGAAAVARHARDGPGRRPVAAST